MERLHGVPLTDLAAIRSITSADPEQTLITALNTWFGSVLGCETFHADVHAGQAAGAPHALLPATCASPHACMPFATQIRVRLFCCTATACRWRGMRAFDPFGLETISHAHLQNSHQQHC